MSVFTAIRGAFGKFFRLPHPVIASFAAAAAALFPIGVMVITEMYSAPSGVISSQSTDDAGERSAAVILSVFPFIYIIAVIVCHAVGTLLVSLGKNRLGQFIGAATIVLLILAVPTGFFLGKSPQFGWGDAVWSVLITVFLAFMTGLPAAFCWWLFVPRAITKKI